MNKSHPQGGDYFIKRLTLYMATAIVAVSGALCFFPGLISALTSVPGHRLLISWSLTAVIITLSLFSLKKRVAIMAFGKLSTWYNIHFFLGLAAVILLPLHMSFFPGSGISLAMTVLMFLIALNGIFGFSVHAFMPPTLLKLQLRNDSLDNIRRRERELEERLTGLICGKSPAFIDFCRNLIKGREKSLIAFFATIFSKESTPTGSRTTPTEVPSGCSEAELNDAEQLRGVSAELGKLKEQIRLITLLNRWLVYHISAVTILVLLLLLHITSFYYY